MSDDRQKTLWVIQNARVPLSVDELLPLCLKEGVPVGSVNPNVWFLVDEGYVRFTSDWKVEAVFA